MKLRQNRFLPSLLLAPLLLASPASAANISKANNADALQTGTAWTGGNAPTSIDTAYFDASVVSTSGNRTTTLGSDVSWGTIRVDGGSGAFSIGSPGGNTITLNGSTDASARLDSILLNSSSGPSLTIGSNLAIATNNTYFTSSRSLTINGNINLGTNTLKLFPAGATSLIEINGIVSGTAASGVNALFTDQNSGSGIIRLTNALNDFSGRIELGSSASGMRLEFTSAGALGTTSEIRFRNTGGTAGAGSALRYTGTTDAVISQTIQCDTSIGMRIESNSTNGSLTLNGAFNQSNRPLYLGGTGIGNNTLSMAFNGSGVLTKRDAGKWILTGTNANSGSTTISGGTLAIGNGGGIYRGGFNGSAVVSVGSGTTLELQNWNYNESTASLGGLANTAGRISINGGTIRMTGTSAYGRGVTVNAGGATFEASAGATWTFDDSGDGNVAFVYNDNPSLSFAGDGSFVFNKNFSGSGNLSKSGPGVLTFAGSSTHSGTTQVSAGTLLVTGSLGSTAVTVQNNATLGGSGTLGGSLTFEAGSKLDLTGATLGLNSSDILSVAGAITLTDFGFANLLGWDWANAPAGTYTLISGGSTVTLAGSTPTAATPFDLGNGRSAYFQSGSLQAVVIPEPASALLGAIGLILLLRRRR
jgi:autotransporter-associated beta strand protein